MVQKDTLGVILSAGKSTRLYPATLAITKQLLPVYDKPMIYYPLTTLMLSGIRKVLVITSIDEYDVYYRLLGDGSDFGMNIAYMQQEKPEGIAQALTIANDLLAVEWRSDKTFSNENFSSLFLILGDNCFHGSGLTKILKEAVHFASEHRRAQTFFQRVRDPERFGVGEFAPEGHLLGIEEKPKHPKSNYASVGAYVYPINDPMPQWDGIKLAQTLTPSKRGELEITDLNSLYLAQGMMDGHKLPRGTAWFDCGTHESLIEAAVYVKAIQNSQGTLVASPHEIAYNQKWINENKIVEYIDKTGGSTKNAYNEYLMAMVESGKPRT